MATSNATIFEYLDALDRSRRGDAEAMARFTAPIEAPARKPAPAPKPRAPKLQPGLL